MEGIIKVAFMFTIFSVITLLVYLKHNKNKRYKNLSFDIPSVLVYALTACFFLTALVFFVTSPW